MTGTPQVFNPKSGSVTASDKFTMVSWYEESTIGAHIQIYAKGQMLIRIDYGNYQARKEFILNLLRDEESRSKIRRRFDFTDDEMMVLDELSEKLEGLEEPTQQ